MKKLLTLLIAVTSILSYSQEITVAGKIVDNTTNEPLEYATISFLKNSAVVTGGITDTKGNFSIPITQGTYTVLIEYLSYKSKVLGNRTLTKNTNLGNILLEPDVETLDEVEIIAEKTTVEIKLDKKIYNVGKDLTVRGGTVSDVLDNVPSVSVDVEGNVALRGNDNVRILINGKPSGLVGLNSTDALRQLPAESIAKVEVITSPSARYDAEGTAGILNIILRRSKLQGLNGAITLNTGFPWQAGISGNINYRMGDFNFFNTSGYNYRESPGNSFSFTEFLNNEDSSTFLREDRDFDRVREGLNTNLGVEWYVSETSSITAAMVFRDSDDKSNTTNILDEFDNNLNPTNTTLRTDPEFEDDKTIQYSLNYDKQFNGNSQHKLTFDFQYEDSSETERSLINQNGLDVEKVVTDENQNRILLQADFVKPIASKGQFELGYRGDFQNLLTDYLVEQSDDGILFVNNTNLTNVLDFKQYINAVYTQYGNKLGKKFSYLFGLRFEGTRITIDQETSNNFSKKQYNQLFPTANLNYSISEDENITLGYNRRIRRPRSFFINPFPSRSSATNIFQGNPDLDPTISNAFDLGYLKKIGKLTLNGSVYYQHSKNIFSFISRATDDYYIFETNQTVNINHPNFATLDAQYDLINILKRGPVNLATNSRYGGEITVSWRPKRTFNINANLNLFQSITKGSFEDQVLDAENLSWFARLNAKYTLPWKIDWQTRLFYRGPSETAQSKNKGIFSTDLAFSKDVFKDKASIAFNIRDLFNSRKRISESFTPTFLADNEFQWRERSFNLSFTYRFNQKKQHQRRSRGNGDGGDFEF